ncbi:MAG: porin family protein [Rhizobiales bacterium]|nr:porin family protein [Hyphomicrobiales bacterium]
MKRYLLTALWLVAIGAALAPCGMQAAETGLAEVRLAPPADWTGPYAGLHLGGTVSQSRSAVDGFPAGSWSLWDPALPAGYHARAGGFIGGGQVGANVQFGSLVFGLESDLSFSTLDSGAGASGRILNGQAYRSAYRQKLDWFGTLRARLGITTTDRLMVYLTGGVAYGQVAASSSLALPTVAYEGSDDTLRVGWAAGAGIEYALSQALSARLEYLHYTLGATTVVGLRADPAPFQSQTQLGLAGHIVRAGLNYRFGGPAAAAGAAGLSSDFAVETGLRTWYSTGSSRSDWHIYDRSDLGSRLAYGGLAGLAAETFFRIDHTPSGWFVKGFAGIGKLGSGQLKDEDFPPFQDPYSATLSDQRNGHIGYFSADIGYIFLRGAHYRLGGFVGYHYYAERTNGMGCVSIALDWCTPPHDLGRAVQMISQRSQWHSLRLGLTGDVMLSDRLKLTAEAAWLAQTTLSATDSHWLRINQIDFTGPTPQDGTGHSGVQLEAVLSYQVTPAFSLGIGARYWRMATTGQLRFERSTPASDPGLSQPLDSMTERYGGFVQAAMRF